MSIKRMHHVGVVVRDLPAAVAFFTALGFEVEGTGAVGGHWVDRIIGLDGAKSEIAMLRTPDGHSRVELAQFQSPVSPAGDADAPANALGLRHLAFEVGSIDRALAAVRAHGAELVGEVVRYEDVYRLCYVRGPEGILVELAEPLGA
ncbi:catechol 2,3-dioxygenase-like lactoylglutathione lyase family enzyme [Crossiella equi]|uniref:Catechol 2,3-dioxygenase-like lactoylglutathione lyase family enzyme n=1 Tax=Crossiella equi TaxID=130796 RepID=A0ABS5AJR3_9PSEU|nr:VOC family protein [Crossiella equi]MBP2476492.1 catechol 2,3-dioxygenase-like lactoylglutathione lyase family enzyme [Crossiella equi]